MSALEELEQQSMQRFDFESLMQFLQETRVSELCGMLGASADLIKRYSTKGLSVDEADVVACRLGVNPSAIWDEWTNIKFIPEYVLDMADAFLASNKKCKRCSTWRNKNDDFYSRSNTPDKRSLWCKSCTREYNDERKKARA